MWILDCVNTNCYDLNVVNRKNRSVSRSSTHTLSLSLCHSFVNSFPLTGQSMNHCGNSIYMYILNDVSHVNRCLHVVGIYLKGKQLECIFVHLTKLFRADEWASIWKKKNNTRENYIVHLPFSVPQSTNLISYRIHTHTHVDCILDPKNVIVYGYECKEYRLSEYR